MKIDTKYAKVLFVKISTCVLAAVCLGFGGSAAAQIIPDNSKLYISPMNGFENYLQAALLAKKVPVTVLLNESQANYAVTGNWRETEGGTSGFPLKARTNYSASVSIVNPKTSAVIAAFSAQQSGTHDLSKEIAENIANQLLKAMKPRKK